MLAALTEPRPGVITITLFAQGIAQASTPIAVDLLPLLHWPGLRVLPELLAAYVRPDTEVLPPIAAEMAQWLEQSTGNGSLLGYAAVDPQRVPALVQAAYHALQRRDFQYIAIPPNFATDGLQLRTHEQVLQERAANCLDLSLLLAALLQRCGLHPLIILSDHYALTGVWLTDFSLQEPGLDDPKPLRKRIELDLALVVDITPAIGAEPFDIAFKTPLDYVRDDGSFHVAVDSGCARDHTITPLVLKNQDVPASQQSLSSSFAPPPTPLPQAEPTRIDRWGCKTIGLVAAQPPYQLPRHQDQLRAGGRRLRCPGGHPSQRWNPAHSGEVIVPQPAAARGRPGGPIALSTAPAGPSTPAPGAAAQGSDRRGT